ncbi:MAG: hypothetical protein JXB35_06935 [Anaerolineae bacterium]|nr:hypothetical protein [Anaerolineae bacterium]
MNEILDSNQLDSDEFESLYTAFGAETPEEPAEPRRDRTGGLRGLFGKVRKRREVTKPSPSAAPAAVPASQISPDFDAAALEKPLDLERARATLLEPEAPPQVHPLAPSAAPLSEKPVAARRKFLGFNVTQLAILGVLLVLVLAIYIVLGTVMLRSARQAATQLVVESLSTMAPEMEPTEDPGEGATEEPAGGGATPVGVPETPTPTPQPAPRVTTRLDLQVLQNPDDVELRIQRAGEYLNLKVYDLALADCDHVLSLDKTNSEAHMVKGQALFFMKRWEEAEAALGSAISFDDDVEAAHFWLGLLLFRKGRYDDAFTEFDWAAEINPENPVNEAWLARSAVKLENADEARAAIDRGLEFDDELPVLYIAQAEWRIFEGDIDGAQGDLLYAQSLDSHDFEVLNTLARFYADYVPERLVEAERLVQQALNWATWDLEKAYALHTLGRIYLAQERKEDAKVVLAEASDLANVDGQVGIFDLITDLDRAVAP